MKQYTFLLVVILFANSNLNAQNRNTIWCFGDSAGIDFRSPANPLAITSSMDVRGACASICDSSGNLQFYAGSQLDRLQVMLWNSLHQPLLNAIDSFPSGGHFNDVQIIPMPGVTNKYYVFHTGFYSGFTGLYYAIVNMDLDGGLGGVESKFNHITSNEMADCLQAIKHANGRDWWLIGKSNTNSQTRNNRFYVYLITPSGISPVTNYDFNNISDVYFQKIIVSPNESKIMQMTYLGFMCEYDFDRCSGAITNPNVIMPEQTTTFNRLFWDGAYSPAGNLFYTTFDRQNFTDTGHLIQYNLTDTNIALSADTIWSYSGSECPGAVRLAPDGKIYVASRYASTVIYSIPYADSMYNYINMNLGVINDPDLLGSACNFQPFSFYLAGKRTYIGLPNNPQYDLGPVIGSVCDTLINSVDNKTSEEIKFDVFPNPFYKSITIHSQSAKNIELKLYNNLSSLILTRKFRDNIQLDLSLLSSGTYQLELISEKNVVMKRIVKAD